MNNYLRFRHALTRILSIDISVTCFIELCKVLHKKNKNVIVANVV